MESKLKSIGIIIVIVSIVFNTGEATNDYDDVESDPSFDDAATKYLTSIDSQLDVLDRNQSNKMVFSECNFQKDDFKKIITSVTKAMDFFTLRLRNVVLDAAIGTRLLQSQLKVVQDGHPKLPPALKMYLTNLQLQSELLSELIIESVSDNIKFTKQSKQEQLPWVLNSSLWEQPKVGGWKSLEILETDQQLNASSPFKKFDRSVEVLTEEISDRCTAELFDDCKVTDNCTQIFAEKPHSAYSLTHQVLFFLIAEKKNCFHNEHFKSKIQGNSLNTFLDKLCKDVLLEGNFIEHSGYPHNYRDLLSEQITVCSVAGYPNFLKRQWMDEILSWQNKEAVGCFSLEASDVVADVVADEEEDEEEEDDDDPSENEDEGDEILRDAAGLALTQQNRENRRKKISKMNLRRRLSSTTNNRNRVKRADEIVKIGKKNCSVHFTAVSLGALSMYLRYFVDTCLNQY